MSAQWKSVDSHWSLWCSCWWGHWPRWPPVAFAPESGTSTRRRRRPVFHWACCWGGSTAESWITWVGGGKDDEKKPKTPSTHTHTGRMSHALTCCIQTQFSGAIGFGPNSTKGQLTLLHAIYIINVLQLHHNCSSEGFWGNNLCCVLHAWGIKAAECINATSGGRTDSADAS